MLNYCGCCYPERVSVVYDETWDIDTKLCFLKEQYKKAIAEIEKLKNIVLNFDSTIYDEVIKELKPYIDSEIKNSENALNEKIKNLQLNIIQQFANIETDFNNKLSKSYADLNSKINLLNKLALELSTSIQQLYKLIENLNVGLGEKFDNLRTELYAYIDSTIKDKVNVYAINPLNGNLEPLNKILQDILNCCFYGWLTVEEYGRCGLTVEEYGRLNLTCLEYQIYMRAIVHDRLYGLMRSPFTGKIVPYKEVINDLADLHKLESGAITAGEYDALKITADDYDAKKITAFQYDWEAKHLLG